MTRKSTPSNMPCSIEGCDAMVLARGWCSKHYSRWLNNGDPLKLTRLKREPDRPVASSRWFGSRKVFFTDAGEPFVEIKRMRAGEQVVGRRYGRVFLCEGCKKESFSPDGGAGRFRFCSRKCAGPATGHAKLGKRPLPKKPMEQLDKFFSVLVRFDGVCVNCGSTERLQCAHGFSRRYRSVRWDARNAFCLCAGCHMFYTHRPLEWDEWLLGRWGAELYAELRALALQTAVKVDYEAVRDALVAETIRRGITANQLPRTVSGWTGLRDVA